jgi:hypothetical protein
VRPLVPVALALLVSSYGPPARATGTAGSRAATAPRELLRGFPVNVHDFKVLERDSGPRNYYRTMSEMQDDFIRGVYSPSLKTVTLFAEVPDAARRGTRSFRFRWRALVLPRGGNECIEGRGDSAASVYVAWKRGLRWYSLKLVWSAEAPLGATCNRTRNPLVASDSIVLRSGGPTGVWREEDIDPEALFREHFEGGRADAEVPELQGIGILTDGDQTHSVSAADYAGFVLYKQQDRTASR